MTLSDNIGMALASIRATKQRSFLTMLGVIVAVASVIVVSSLGEGIKQQVGQQVENFGADLVTVLPGRISGQGNAVEHARVFLQQGVTSPLTDSDYKAASAAKVSAIVPFAKVTGVASTEQRTHSANVVGTTVKAFEVLGYKVEYGTFFDDSQSSRQSAVIGRRVAEKLFNENVPIGKPFKVRDQEFFVRGVIEDIASEQRVLNGGVQHNDTIFVQYEVAQIIMGGYAPLYQIIAKPPADVSPKDLAVSLQEKIKKSRAGETDFSVLTQSELKNLIDANLVLVMLFVYVIAVIAAVVGGVGIMNVMLVVVAERMREIGIRKAVGATSWQILKQFLTEAMILSFSGGVFGVILAITTNILLRILTDLQPVITLETILVSVAGATALGAIFGAAPAFKAGSKDPIDALRA